jgi:hypothetical protein
LTRHTEYDASNVDYDTRDIYGNGMVRYWYWYVLVLGDGHVADVVGHTPVFVFVQLSPPLLLHWPKDRNVQGLCQMCGIGREEDKPS